MMLGQLSFSMKQKVRGGDLLSAVVKPVFSPLHPRLSLGHTHLEVKSGPV